MSILFQTNLRRKLLAYSYTHPDEDHYVRELSLLISEDAGNLSRELRKLENEGVYKSFVRGKEKYYSLNKNYPLFKQMKEIIFKTEGVAGAIKKVVDSYEGVELAVIYGSYAKNKESKMSDVDLVIVGDFSVNNFTAEIRDLENKLNREINFNSYTKKEFYKELNKRGGFLNTVMKDKIVILKGKLNERRR